MTLSADNSDVLAAMEKTPKSPKSRNDFDLSFLDDPSIVYGSDPKYLNEDGVDERLLFKYTLPKAKLYYPEPFIASPSYIHSDLIFLNILQYWYWLWFIFMYLIALFFLSFLVVMRWCSTHRRPRRETQGVSRSKCGDLITACVPVSWAASIIISESTDAADLNDGFGTGEIVIGVRAYQWGWEYYYPKSIDLLYNVSPTYSSFVGNSLKYNHTSGLASSTNDLWRQYQVKPQDSAVTPASLVFNTLGSLPSGAQTQFKNSGVDSLKLSGAFPRIRNNTKVYNTHLIHDTNTSSDKNFKISSLYSSANSSLEALDFGITRSSNFVSGIALLNSENASLDNKSLSNFLNTQTNHLNLESFEDKASLLGLNYLSLPSSNSNTFDGRTSTNPASDFSSITKKTRLSNPSLSDAEDKILQGEQSFQEQKFVNPSKDSAVYSSVLDNKASESSTPISVSSFSEILSGDSARSSYTGALHANTFAATALPPVMSTDSLRNRFGASMFDGTSVTEQIKVAERSSKAEIKIESTNEIDTTISANIGSLEKISAGTQGFYWSSCWANINPTLRLSETTNAVNEASNFYLPAFELYADYDFRNEQSYMLLEDLYWEFPYSSFNYYDYMSLAEASKKDRAQQPKLSEMTHSFLPANTAVRLAKSNNNTMVSDALALVSLHSDEFFVQPKKASAGFYSNLPTLNDISENDESYANLKGFTNYLLSNNSQILPITNFAKLDSSSVKVFNHFTTAYEDFSWSPNTVTNNQVAELSLDASKEDTLSETYNVSSLYNTVSTNSSLNIRPSVKDSIVNYNAFQKVFRSRMDEGRAHINASHFSNISLEQPFINDKGVPYTNLLGKNRSSFYQTPFYTSYLKDSLSPLYAVYTQNNTQMFDFPFLAALQSDLIRYTWMDGYSKWLYTEVQPSSVSKYSTLGVPYLRKPFDFDVNTGDNVFELQMYFTRATRSRKNYLPNWMYSPLLFNRQKSLQTMDPILTTLRSTDTNSSDTLSLLVSIATLRSQSIETFNHSNTLNSSVSGNSIYNKSTWRPQAGVAAYHHNVTHLVDILSKREQLIREYMYAQKGTVYIPMKYTASPQNLMLKTVMKSFKLEDPLNYSSDYSRDYLISSVSYFKFLHLKAMVSSLRKAGELLPVNPSLLNNYVLFYFLFGDSEPRKANYELYKNQYRPLRKGVNSMLRLHATGAIAMPVEVRLQILASSKDVIHSWSVPSAGIKIDCIPGYTSHRIMKFMITGIYWGQCQEICGRYHHWMPIVAYFIKRDLFFLWCTHFVYKPQHQDSWEISDRKFANFLRFVSYDKSSWLSEVAQL